MSMKFMLAAVLGIMTSSLALADKMGPNGDKFYEAAAKFENACSQDVCKAPYTSHLVYNQSTRLNKLDATITTEIRRIAVDQAHAWGDATLEGDYQAAGRTRLDQVVAYYKGKNLVGYKIQYSEKAWYVGDCNFNGTLASLKGCKQGRVVEGSYVSPDLLTYFSDEERHAEFSFTQN
ncbi:hypothetical protein D3C87_1174970 [compost metagenome]